MRTYCVAQGTLFIALWKLKWEENPKKRGYMYTYSRLTLLYSRNQHNIVKQLYANKNKFKMKKENTSPYNIIVKSHWFNFEQKKTDTKECILYDFISVKLSNREDKFMMREVRITLLLQWRRVLACKSESICWDDGEVLYLDLGGGDLTSHVTFHHNWHLRLLHIYCIC